MQYEDFIRYAKRWGLSREDLAEKIGIAVNSLYNYKNGKPLQNKTKYKLKAFYDKYIDTITRTQATPTITRTQATPTITRTQATPTITRTQATPTITRTQATPTITRTQATPTITRTLKTERVELADETEIIDALNNGETVIGNNGSKYRKINGFVVKYGISDSPLFIGAAIDLVNSYHVVREIPLKLKVGEKYKRADGVVGNVFAVTPIGTYRVTFMNDVEIYTYKEDGTCITERVGEEFNLVEEC